MGYSGKIKEKEKAQDLRRKGLSYNEILSIISVSKDTISLWCRDIKLTEDQIERLAKKRKDAALRGRIKGAKRQQAERVRKTLELLKNGEKEIGQLSKRERFIAGVALYAGEGSKSDGELVFTNSDPKMILFMSKWFEEFCSVKPVQIRGSLWLHEGLDENVAKDFWASLIGIPKENFYKTYIAKNKTESKKIRKKLHNYGIFSIRFSNATKHRKLMGWISGLLSI